MTIPPRLLWFAIPLLVGALPAPAQVTLGLVATNGLALFHWPASATDYVLQSATNLASANWRTATDALPATYGLQNAVTVTNRGSGRFFRLLQVPATVPAGMAPIPAGAFIIGNSSGDSDPDHETPNPTNVTVSAFYMDTNLVSYSQWLAVFAYATNHAYGFAHAGAGKGPDHPAQSMDWFDAVKWCNARSQQAGWTPAYYQDAGLTQVYTNGAATPYVQWGANGYRLPTEAEWEKAARGGLSGQRFPWGNTISWSQANYYGVPLALEPSGYAYDLSTAIGYDPAFHTGAVPYSSPVGSFAPNGYGLYDMAGNVTEWCWDWYNDDYTLAGSPYAGGTDPHGPATSVFGSRVLRGGAYAGVAAAARCANRIEGGPLGSNPTWGFRCVKGH